MIWYKQLCNWMTFYILNHPCLLQTYSRILQDMKCQHVSRLHLTPYYEILKPLLFLSVNQTSHAFLRTLLLYSSPDLRLSIIVVAPSALTICCLAERNTLCGELGQLLHLLTVLPPTHCIAYAAAKVVFQNKSDHWLPCLILPLPANQTWLYNFLS